MNKHLKAIQTILDTQDKTIEKLQEQLEYERKTNWREKSAVLANGTPGLVSAKYPNGEVKTEPAHFYDGKWKLDLTLKKPEILGWMPYPLPCLGGIGDWRKVSLTATPDVTLDEYKQELIKTLDITIAITKEEDDYH